jgi:hypothetical protein
MSRRWPYPFGRSAESAARARRLPARKTLAAALAVPLAATGLAFAAAGSAHAAAAKIEICHADSAGKKPYNDKSVSIPDAVGHIGHRGPIYSTGAASWGDIIPPFTYTDSHGVPTNFPGLNWTPEGQAILANGCGIPATVTPVDPTVTDPVCVAGVLTPPALTLPGAPAGVTYTASPAGGYAAGDSVTVTATTDAGHWFQAPAPAGWTFVDLQHETYSFTFANPACVPIGPGAPVTVAPVDPIVIDTACVAGVLTPPTLTPAATPVGVTYTTSKGAPYAPGDTVTVTASIAAPALFTFTAPAPAGWVFVNATTETFTITFANPACVPIGPGVPTVVSPVAPTVTNSVCAAGVATTPTLTLAALPGGVLYTPSKPAPYAAGDSLTVTASILAPLLDTFAAPGTGGWTFVNATTETYDVTFAAAPVCAGVGGVAAGPTTVTPVTPTFGDPGCGAGGATAPFVTTPSTPSGVAYTVSPAGPYAGGQTVTVTATITDPADQFTAPGSGGWTFVDATHETITHTFAAAPACSGVGGLKAVSAHPTFADATCADGTLTGASYTLPDVDGVRYLVDGKHRAAGSYPAANGSTVTITLVATDGFTLRDDAPIVHTFADAPQCLAVEPTTTSTQPLASTGAPVVPLAELGALLTALGAALLFGARRRSRKAI